MEKVKIRKCESIMEGKAHSMEILRPNGSIIKATAWCDKVDCGALMSAYQAMDEIEVELKPYTSKVGKTGLNIVAINYIKGNLAPELEVFDAKQGNASANGQYQKPVAEEMPKPEDFGEADITSINAKSSVKIKKNSKGIGWEIKVVTGEVDLIHDLGQAAVKEHGRLCRFFPEDTTKPIVKYVV